MGQDEKIIKAPIYVDDKLKGTGGCGYVSTYTRPATITIKGVKTTIKCGGTFKGAVSKNGSFKAKSSSESYTGKYKTTGKKLNVNGTYKYTDNAGYTSTYTLKMQGKKDTKTGGGSGNTGGGLGKGDSGSSTILSAGAYKGDGGCGKNDAIVWTSGAVAIKLSTTGSSIETYTCEETGRCTAEDNSKIIILENDKFKFKTTLSSDSCSEVFTKK